MEERHKRLERRYVLIYCIWVVVVFGALALGVYFLWEHLPQILHHVKEAWRNS
jgi:hypothetical protein